MNIIKVALSCLWTQNGDEAVVYDVSGEVSSRLSDLLHQD